MLHTSLVPFLIATASEGKVRPTLACINRTDENVYESTDSFTLTRITPKEQTTPFPDIKKFMPANPVWETVPLQDLINASELAILNAKQTKSKIAYLIIGPENVTSSYDGYFLKYNLNHVTAIDAKRLIKFLKPLKNHTGPVQWYQENPLSPLAFKMETTHGTVEYLIMPLKI